MTQLLFNLYRYIRAVIVHKWSVWRVGTDRCVWCQRPATWFFRKVRHPFHPKGMALCGFHLQEVIWHYAEHDAT
jgi:hypothetical protein